jgi:hypothetical protein
VDVVLIRTEEGLKGLGEKSGKHYDEWRNHVRSLEVGQTVRFSWKKPRSLKFHGLHFALLTRVYEAQEQFQSFDAFRLWVQVGAGLCDLVPGPTGKPVAIPRSISFETMDDLEFADHHQAAKDFLRSSHACRFLWPMLPEAAAGRAIDELVAEFES